MTTDKPTTPTTPVPVSVCAIIEAVPDCITRLGTALWHLRVYRESGNVGSLIEANKQLRDTGLMTGAWSTQLRELIAHTLNETVGGLYEHELAAMDAATGLPSA